MPNVCGCAAESDGEFCSLNSVSCGPLSGTDNCGQARNVESCGTCVAPQSCGGGGMSGVCGCTPESDSQFCQAQGVTCGTANGTDNCGASRSANCGQCNSCSSPNTIAAYGGVLSGTTSGTNTYTSTCGGDGPNQYYTWIPDVSGPATVSTCGSSFATVLDVLSGSCPSGSLVGCNENTTVWCYNDTTDSLVAFNAVAGTPYYFVIGGQGTAAGAFTLKVAPPDGTCASPYQINAAGGAVSTAFNGNNQGSTGSCGGAGADRVHLWVPTTSGTAMISLQGDFWPAALYVDSGSCTGTEMACNYQAGQWPTESVSFAVNAGTPYYVWVANGSYQGQSVMMYTLTVTAP
jgi:hypothetical protein